MSEGYKNATKKTRFHMWNMCIAYGDEAKKLNNA